MINYDKILACLLGASIGDAMGSPTETRNTRQIKEKFGGFVNDFVDSPDDVFSAGCPKGSVTDDFSLAYYTVNEIIKRNGVIDDECAKQALINWGDSDYIKFAGPTTKAAINNLKGLFNPYISSLNIAVDNSKGSNGGAMKIAPIALFSNGNFDKAMKDTITILKPTHFNNSSLSGACAISAAIAYCLSDYAVEEGVYEAALKGAEFGDEYGRKYGSELSTPSVYKRIKLAIGIGKKYENDLLKAMEEIADIIGAGLASSEAVPAVFGILAATHLKPMEAIVAAVNMGNDTDTVASMVGAIACTYNSYFNKEKLDIINNVNMFDLEATARKIEGIVNGK